LIRNIASSLVREAQNKEKAYRILASTAFNIAGRALVDVESSFESDTRSLERHPEF
jgi:hypothetical protein